MHRHNKQCAHFYVCMFVNKDTTNILCGSMQSCISSSRHLLEFSSLFANKSMKYAVVVTDVVHNESYVFFCSDQHIDSSVRASYFSFLLEQQQCSTLYRSSRDQRKRYCCCNNLRNILVLLLLSHCHLHSVFLRNVNNKQLYQSN